jgi:predicted RND superfamily exporter protein
VLQLEGGVRASPVALVVLVVFLFLQSWRAALIPVLAIPVSVFGAFAVMALPGGSISAGFSFIVGPRHRAGGGLAQ